DRLEGDGEAALEVEAQLRAPAGRQDPREEADGQHDHHPHRAEARALHAPPHHRGRPALAGEGAICVRRGTRSPSGRWARAGWRGYSYAARTRDRTASRVPRWMAARASSTRRRVHHTLWIVMS